MSKAGAMITTGAARFATTIRLHFWQKIRPARSIGAAERIDALEVVMPSQADKPQPVTQLSEH